MKESTGELSMVVVTILAIILIAGVVRFLVPKAQEYIEKQWGNIAGEGYITTEVDNLVK